MTVARTPENKNWNRFKNIVVCELVFSDSLMYNQCASNSDDGNRVVLKPIPGRRSLQHDFINASYIDVSMTTCNAITFEPHCTVFLSGLLSTKEVHC